MSTLHHKVAAVRKVIVAATVVMVLVAGAVVAILAWPAAGSAADTCRSSGPAPGIDTWAAGPADLGPSRGDRTVRNIVHTSIDGNDVRVRLSNVYGTAPVTFDSVYLGQQADGAAVVAGSNRRATFGGQTTVSIPPGAEVLSDAIPTTVAAGVNLAVSVHATDTSDATTGHPKAKETNFEGPGDVASAETNTGYTGRTNDWYWVDGVVVDHPGAATVVALGDSITNGSASTDNSEHRWPDYLADRLRAAGGPQFGVANEGIGGNKVTAGVNAGTGAQAGPSAQCRFQRDVVDQPGASTVILLEGVNDIGGGYVTSADQLIAADQQIITRAHAAGLRIVGGTLTPFQGAGYYTPQKEAIRESVNTWIRTGGAFDGVADFDAAVRDPSNPRALLPAYDSGGHLHPNDAGDQAMANAVDLTALRPR